MVKNGAQGETRTRTDYSTATSRQRGYHYTTGAILVRDKRFELLTTVESGRDSTTELITLGC